MNAVIKRIPSLRGTKQSSGTSLRGTKQSSQQCMDCFATARNDGMPRVIARNEAIQHPVIAGKGSKAIHSNDAQKTHKTLIKWKEEAVYIS